MPKIPSNITEVHNFISQLPINTIKSENFVLYNNISTNVITFKCKTKMTFMMKSSMFYVDGTFSYCSKYFSQLFPVCTYVNYTFCLLPNKNKCTYKIFFEVLIEKFSILFGYRYLGQRFWSSDPFCNSGDFSRHRYHGL